MVKHALIIGINYNNRAPITPLPGCIEDGIRMEAMLRDHMGYTSITFLRDDATDAASLPTKQNIMFHLHRLGDLSASTDEMCIYYSGHGSLIYDFSGDENFGQRAVSLQQLNSRSAPRSDYFGADSIIFPCNTYDAISEPLPGSTVFFASGGHYIVGPIIDDEVQLMIRRFQCPTLIFMDCCNNGSGADLEWSFEEILAPHLMSPRIHNNRMSIDNPNIFMISGSRDQQLSIELNLYQQHTQFGGLLTFALLNCLRDANYSIDLAKLYCNIYFGIQNFTAFLATLLSPPPGGYQIPVFSSSSPSPEYQWTCAPTATLPPARSSHQVVRSAMSMVKRDSVHQRYFPKLF